MCLSVLSTDKNLQYSNNVSRAKSAILYFDIICPLSSVHVSTGWPLQNSSVYLKTVACEEVLPQDFGHFNGNLM